MLFPAWGTLRRFASSIAVVLTVLVAAEATARVEDRLRLKIPLAASPSNRDLVTHDEFGMRGRPNARYRKWRLNQFGFRGGEVDMAPRPDCRRVMILGASETFGLYESEGEEYPAQLAALLVKSGCYEVINAAVAGMTARTIGSFWDNWASRFKADVVVIYPSPAFYLATVRPADVPLPEPRPATAPVASVWPPRIWDRTMDRLQMPAAVQRWRVEGWLAGARSARPPGWLFEAVPAERVDDFAGDVDRLVCRVASTGARPVIVTHATAFHDPPSPAEHYALQAWNVFVPRATASTLISFERAAAGRLLSLAADRGVTAVDAYKEMYGHREWFADDLVHFSDAGAGTIANLIADALARSPLAPGGMPGAACGRER